MSLQAIEPTEWDWYLAALEASRKGQKLPSITEEPQTGYYRMRPAKTSPWDAVAIWRDGDELVTLFNGEEMPAGWIADYPYPNAVMTRWMGASKSPITFEAYTARIDTGRWPDEAEAVSEPAQIGDNSREMSPQEVVEAALNRCLADATLWLKKLGKDAPATKADADQGANLAKNVADAAKAVAAVHTELKAPFLKEGQKLDAWKRSVCDPAEVTKKDLLAKVSIWMVTEQRRLDEERRKAEAEARAKAEAERQVKIAELNRIAAENAAVVLAATKPEEQAAQLATIEAQAKEAATAIVVKPDPVKAVRATTGGTAGRKSSLRSVKTAVITDFALALSACSDTEEVRAAVQAVADKRAKAGQAMAGVEVKETQEARL